MRLIHALRDFVALDSAGGFYLRSPRQRRSRSPTRRSLSCTTPSSTRRSTCASGPCRSPSRCCCGSTLAQPGRACRLAHSGGDRHRFRARRAFAARQPRADPPQGVPSHPRDSRRPGSDRDHRDFLRRQPCATLTRRCLGGAACVVRAQPLGCRSARALFLRRAGCFGCRS